jgi:glutaredoxin
MKSQLNSRRLPVVACLVVAIAFPFAADAQTTYRWVDKDGKVFYSDQPPPKEIKKVEQRRLGVNSIDTSGLPYETQKAAQDHPVTLYTSPDCKAECQGARELLTRRGIPFRETSISNPDEAATFRKTFGTDKVGVPSITVGNQKQQGIDEGSWGGMLDNAGYPRSPAGSAPPAAAK